MATMKVRNDIMFNLKRFEAMLSQRGITKKELATYLGISLPSLYRRLQKGGDFTKNEITMLINYFGRDEVLNCLFCYE